MYNKIRLNERELHRLISESVMRILEDEEIQQNRRFLDNPAQFAKDLGQFKARKKGTINARPAKGTEKLITYKQDPSIAGDGEDNIESVNDFSNGMVANNVNTPWQLYGIPQATFDSDYEQVPGSPDQYRKTAYMLASELKDDVSFPSPWGQGNMNIDKGGYMLQNPTTGETYGIQKSDFDNTYERFPEESNESIIHRAIMESVRHLSRH